MEKVFYSWSDVNNFINALEKVVDKKEFKGVYGIPRGGLILAVIISHRLSIPLLNAPCENCIIVDDICDTGESLIHYVNNSSGSHKPSYYIATMVAKENEFGIKPDFSLFTKLDDWVVFPWEKQ